jgi:hypothetical protein
MGHWPTTQSRLHRQDVCCGIENACKKFLTSFSTAGMQRRCTATKSVLNEYRCANKRGAQLGEHLLGKLARQLQTLHRFLSFLFVSNNLGLLLFARKLTPTLGTDRVLSRFCYSQSTRFCQFARLFVKACSSSGQHQVSLDSSKTLVYPGVKLMLRILCG